MTHTLSRRAVRDLANLIGRTASQLVLDINAVYVCTPTAVMKIEATVATPSSPEPHEYDEIFPIDVLMLSPDLTFRAGGDPPHWYRVLAENTRVIGIDVVRVVVDFPSETLRAPSSKGQEPSVGSNLVDCGVLIHTAAGVLMAVQQHPTFGFHNGPTELLDVQQAIALLPAPYEVVPLPAP